MNIELSEEEIKIIKSIKLRFIHKVGFLGFMIALFISAEFALHYGEIEMSHWIMLGFMFTGLIWGQQAGLSKRFESISSKLDPIKKLT